MPISTSSFGDDRDDRYNEYGTSDQYDSETLEFPEIDSETAEALLKRLGGGVAEKHKLVEGIGWTATINEQDHGVSIQFQAHDELLDDLIRRFEQMADSAV